MYKAAVFSIFLMMPSMAQDQCRVVTFQEPWRGYRCVTENYTTISQVPQHLCTHICMQTNCGLINYNHEKSYCQSGLEDCKKMILSQPPPFHLYVYPSQWVHVFNGFRLRNPWMTKIFCANQWVLHTESVGWCSERISWWVNPDRNIQLHGKMESPTITPMGPRCSNCSLVVPLTGWPTPLETRFLLEPWSVGIWEILALEPQLSVA